MCFFSAFLLFFFFFTKCMLLLLSNNGIKVLLIFISTFIASYLCVCVCVCMNVNVATSLPSCVKSASFLLCLFLFLAPQNYV